MTVIIMSKKMSMNGPQGRGNAAISLSFRKEVGYSFQSEGPPCGEGLSGPGRNRGALREVEKAVSPVWCGLRERSSRRPPASLQDQGFSLERDGLFAESDCFQKQRPCRRILVNCPPSPSPRAIRGQKGAQRTGDPQNN